MKVVKSIKQGKEIKTYEEFVKLNPKSIFFLETSTENDYAQYLVDADNIQNEIQFKHATEEEPYKIYEVVKEYYSKEVVEFANMLQQLRDDYDEDSDIFENAERLYNKGWRIEK